MTDDERSHGTPQRGDLPAEIERDLAQWRAATASDVPDTRTAVARARLERDADTPWRTFMNSTRPWFVPAAVTAVLAVALLLVPVSYERTTGDRVTLALAKAISEIFSEVIIAPEFNADARSLLSKKKNLRLMQMLKSPPERSRDVRSVVGGLLVQDADSIDVAGLEQKVVTQRPPTKDEIEAMEFGWKVVKHVKSNAIVYSGRDRTLGIGAGQMSRVDASRIAVWKAHEAGLSLKGSAVCSDAFFPFPDGLITAADAGATCVIQPGGSVRDDEVIAAADERGLAMAFTGARHFKH